MTEKELFGISEQLDCSDCVNHGGDWDCDHVHCRKGMDTISRQAAIDAVHEEFDECTVWDESGEYTADVVERILDDVPAAQPEVRPIDYQDCSNAMLKMWMDNVVTDGEYNRIMDKLNAHWGKKNG